MNWIAQDPCWAELGLEPTDDERAIKRAYAKRLKAIDPDRAPESFLSLRSALENAQDFARNWEHYQADSGEDHMFEYDPEDEFFIDDQLPIWREPNSLEGQFTARPTDFSQLENFKPVALDGEDFTVIQSLLESDTPRAEIANAIEDHAANILHDLRMAEFVHSAAVENWILTLLDQHGVRADALLVPAMDHFVWWKQANQWGLDPRVAAAIDSDRAHDDWIKLREPKDKHHKAWVDITRGADGLHFWHRRRAAKRIDAMAHDLARTSPGALGRFDPALIAFWQAEKRRDGERGHAIWQLFTSIPGVAFSYSALLTGTSSLNDAVSWNWLVCWAVLACGYGAFKFAGKRYASWAAEAEPERTARLEHFGLTALLILPLLVGFAPLTLLTLWPILALAAAAMILARACFVDDDDPNQPFSAFVRSIETPCFAFIVWANIGLFEADARWILGILPVMVSCLGVTRMRERVQAIIRQWSKKRQRLITAGITFGFTISSFWWVAFLAFPEFSGSDEINFARYGSIVIALMLAQFLVVRDDAGRPLYSFALLWAVGLTLTLLMGSAPASLRGLWRQLKTHWLDWRDARRERAV